jgi:hypothetical protein
MLAPGIMRLAAATAMQVRKVYHGLTPGSENGIRAHFLRYYDDESHIYGSQYSDGGRCPDLRNRM